MYKIEEIAVITILLVVTIGIIIFGMIYIKNENMYVDEKIREKRFKKNIMNINYNVNKNLSLETQKILKKFAFKKLKVISNSIFKVLVNIELRDYIYKFDDDLNLYVKKSKNGEWELSREIALAYLLDYSDVINILPEKLLSEHDERILQRYPKFTHLRKRVVETYIFNENNILKMSYAYFLEIITITEKNGLVEKIILNKNQFSKLAADVYYDKCALGFLEHDIF